MMITMGLVNLENDMEGIIKFQNDGMEMIAK